jgi:hypothetical protein
VFQQNSFPHASRMQLGGTKSAAREAGAEPAEEYDALAVPFAEPAWLPEI